MYEYLYKKQDSKCMACNIIIENKDNAVIHHINYKYLCHYNIKIEGTGLRKNTTIAKCNECENIEYCSANLSLIHKKCHMLIHIKEGRIKKRTTTSKEYNTSYWTEKSSDVGMDIFTKLVTEFSVLDGEELIPIFRNSYIKLDNKHSLTLIPKKNFVELSIREGDGLILDNLPPNIEYFLKNKRVRFSVFGHQIVQYAKAVWSLYKLN